MAAWSVSRVLDYYFDDHVAKLKSDTPRVAAFKIAHLKRFFKTRSINSVCRADGEAYVTHRNAERRAAGKSTMKSGTLRGELALLVAAAEYCLAAKQITQADLPHLKLPQASPPRERFLRKHEAKHAIAYIENKMKFQNEADRLRLLLFFVIGIYTGARPKAIECLSWSRIDLDSRIIDFRKSHDTGRKRYTQVRLGNELFPFIARAYSCRTTDWVLGHPSDMRYLFERLASEMRWKDITPNSLRHTFASWAVKDGISFEHIAKVLGNTAATVERVYGHLAPDHQTHIVDRKQLTGDESLLWS